ncbi:nuclear transport factor 2 family protein [Hyphomicrobium sp. NDB2Meth4]|uniref:nuclear transport factor 2 family protein n=1 Tax=Hyphomicrobium sp. NDB2Meth4 TaxID=1892846 RepID=UPI00093091B1|nr:nuclear transport factor 2 family protein [Hyphomicrobium sp. NDB2Meth4]
MDTAELLQSFYRHYRERRLADAVAHLGDDFLFKAYLPNDPVDPERPRSRAEFTLICHKFLDEYDILVFEPGRFSFDGDVASVEVRATFCHKRSGKILDTTFHHLWRLADGNVIELRQEHDSDLLHDFLKDLEDLDRAAS